MKMKSGLGKLARNPKMKEPSINSKAMTAEKRPRREIVAWDEDEDDKDEDGDGDEPMRMDNGDD